MKLLPINEVGCDVFIQVKKKEIRNCSKTKAIKQKPFQKNINTI